MPGVVAAALAEFGHFRLDTLPVQTSCKDLMLFCSFQILVEWDLEIHQIMASGITHSGQIKACPGKWIWEAGNIKEKKSGLRTERLDSPRFEFYILNFVPFF